MTPKDYAQALPFAAIAHPTGDVLFVTPNNACQWRVEKFFTKEPDTVAWISTFNPGEVFIDVGANVGMYAVWAAKTTGARVFAFEPESQNFAALNYNILANKIDAVAFPLALSDESGVGPLYLSQFGHGGSCHNFGEPTNYNHEPMRPVFTQGSVAMRLDDLLDAQVIPKPDHIKIDVDGIEDRVIRGAQRSVLAAKSVLVEVNSKLDGHLWILEAMRGYGFETDEAQINAARRKTGGFEGVGNVIFRR